ncbi:MAG: penicillin-binding protein activator [Alphaproteobacteria bacterium]|nr:penicillin-binding protein activator [Alphaproteobacteria bacterium]
MARAALLALMALALAACGGTLPMVGPGPQEGPAPAEIGLLLPLSGPHAALGAAMQRAAEMALFDARAEGASLFPHDTGGTPEGGARAAAAARARGADILVGPVFSGAVGGAAARAAGAPVLAFTTDRARAGGGVYTLGFTTEAQVARVARAAAFRGLTRVAVLAPQDAHGQAAARAWDGAARRHGIATVARGVLAGDADLAARNLAATPADAVFLPAGGTEAVGAARALRGAGFAGALLGTGLWDDPAVLGAAALEGGLYAAPDPAGRSAFEARYAALYGAPPPRLATLAYDAVALAAALARTAEPKADPFAAARLTDPSGFAGLDGLFRFGPDGVAERGLAILEIRSGRAFVAEPGPAAF